MYLKHYNLNAKPFEITADPKFLWFGATHKEAYAVLRYGVLENKGLLLLTGDAGVGKTTLIAALVKELTGDTLHTTIADPGVAVMDFYRHLAHEFGLEVAFASKAEFVRLFRLFLYESYDRGLRVLLIIDEAQRMGRELLEEVRLLSNIEKNGSKLVNIFFVGQTEFLDVLKGPEASALRQRITLSYTIDLLNLNETYRYIASRLKRAGAQTHCFTKAAIQEIHLYSGGAPRVINALCEMAMVLGYSKGVTRLEKQIIRDGAKRLPGIRIPTRQESVGRGEVEGDVPCMELAPSLEPPNMNRDQVKGRSNALFLMICLFLTLLFAVGMSWLTLTEVGVPFSRFIMGERGVETISSSVQGSVPPVY